MFKALSIIISLAITLVAARPIAVDTPDAPVVTPVHTPIDTAWLRSLPEGDLPERDPTDTAWLRSLPERDPVDTTWLRSLPDEPVDTAWLRDLPENTPVDTAWLRALSETS